MTAAGLAVVRAHVVADPGLADRLSAIRDPDELRRAVVDLAFAIVRRATSRSSLATADKGHLHHRLMNLGHGHRRSVLILWTWTALLSAFVLYPILTDQNPEYLPFGMAALAIALFTLLHPSVIEQRRRNSTPAEGVERPPVDPDQPTLFDSESRT